MCFLCLKDFTFDLPVKPNLEQKKKRLLKVKTLLQLASDMKMVEENLCDEKVEQLIEEQYKLSRDF